MSPGGGGVTFRAAQAEDAPELTRLAHAAKAHWGYPAEWLALWEAELTLTAAQVGRLDITCALLDGAIAGFAAVSGTGAERDLAHFWIDPASMGRGIGRALFAHVRDALARAGVRRLTIVADPNAEGFYRQLGAERCGEVPSRPAGRLLPRLELVP